jgi:hypothetical protein
MVNVCRYVNKKRLNLKSKELNVKNPYNSIEQEANKVYAKKIL